jgi:hypothetical protein
VFCDYFAGSYNYSFNELLFLLTLMFRYLIFSYIYVSDSFFILTAWVYATCPHMGV